MFSVDVLVTFVASQGMSEACTDRGDSFLGAQNVDIAGPSASRPVKGCSEKISDRIVTDLKSP